MSGSLVLRELGGTRSGEMATHRLLSSDDVDPIALLTPHVARTAAACNGRRVVAVQDTTEINFDRHRRPATGLGPTGTTKYAAFSFIPSWPWTPMTKRCSAWREHGSGRAARSRHPTITTFLSTRRRADAGLRRPSWRRCILRPWQARSSWWPIARATFIPCSREDPRRSTSWCAQITIVYWQRAEPYSRRRQPGRRSAGHKSRSRRSGPATKDATRRWS